MGGLQVVGGEGPISLLLLLLSIAVVTVSFDRARYWLQWWRQRRLRQNRWEQTAAAGPDGIESQLLEWNSQMAFGEPLLQAAGVIGPLLGLIGTVIGRYQMSTYQGGSADNSSDSSYGVGINLHYQINQHFSTEIGYNFDDLQSKQSGRGYQRNRVYIGLGANY